MKKILVWLMILFTASTVQAMAAASLKLTPSTKSVTTGSTFEVVVGVDSGTEKSQGVDAWVTFDAAKLEVVSIEKAATPAFAFALAKNIYNTEGKFDIACASTDMSTFEATTLKGDLAVVTFRAKAPGTAAVNFTCQSGSSIDSNIFNMSAVDVIDCASNQSGVYTISGTAVTTTAPTATVTTATTTSSELPRTGGIGSTLGLLVFGIVGVFSSLLIKWL